MFRSSAYKKIQLILLTAFIVVTLVSASNGSEDAGDTPKDIPENISCGKCGMYPAKYPKWQTQVIFSDGIMAPFDGCKCMFGFLFNMGQYDKKHTSADVSSIWVKEYNSGEWVDAKKAQYVIGSSELGPMGKELIPFSDISAAETFQKEHGGQIAQYDSITMESLKPLMGKMHMKGKMEGDVQM